MSEWADPGPRLPWLYSYREDAQSTRVDRPVFRPFVPVSLAYGSQATLPLAGLVDTGADSVLASGLLAEALEVDLNEHDGEVTHAVGGRTPHRPLQNDHLAVASR